MGALEAKIGSAWGLETDAVRGLKWAKENLCLGLLRAEIDSGIETSCKGNITGFRIEHQRV